MALFKNMRIVRRFYSALKDVDIKDRNSKLEFKTKIDKNELKKKLTPLQYTITQLHGTERPFSGEHNENKSNGTFECIACESALFASETKYDSHSGWPSFYDCLDKQHITYIRDYEIGTERIEVRCSNCGSHLGHVFTDGPKPTGLRYCINSAALGFRKNADTDKP